jgi:hypothetical protein
VNSNVIVCEIQYIYEFIFFMMTLFFITWNGGQMVKALDCGQGGDIKKQKKITRMIGK